MSRATKLRGRTRRRSLIVGIIVGITLGGGVAGAALSSSDAVQVHAVAQDLRAQADKLDVLANATSTVPASTTTSTPATTTTVPTSGTIVPAGAVCPPSTSSSTYQGNRLTQSQAALALYRGGFRDLTTIRAFIGIGSAESSLCVRTWHYHPEQSCPGFSVCADRGWLQINNHFWPQFPDAQVFDPVGAAQATRTIYGQTNNLGTWDTWPNPAQSLQPSAAVVCAAVPATGCP